MQVMAENGQERPKFARDYQANGRRLRRLRSRAKLTLKQLAQKAGVNYTTINRIEQGRNRSPHWPTLEQLADALGVDVEELVIFEDLDDDPVPDEPGLTKENERRLDEVRQERRERAEREGNSQDDTGDRST